MIKNGAFMRYRNTGRNKENGVVYTPTDMANYLANEMFKYKKTNFEERIFVLDPAVGKGELLIAAIQLLQSQTQAKITVVGYDTDEYICSHTQIQLSKQFPNVDVDIRYGDFLDAVENGTCGSYDFVIANPPYVRTQIIGSEKAQQISSTLSLSGRVDIYYAFLVFTKQVLKEGGIAGYITSNKFLTIKSGASVRNFILDNYQLHCITDLGDTKLFKASVLPCIMVFSLGKTSNRENVKFTSVYENHHTTNPEPVNDIFDAIHKTGEFQTPDGKVYTYQQGVLQSVEKNALWTPMSDEVQQWLERIESKTAMHFSDIGKIRVGIKTTADNVFIGDSWSGKKAELEWLRPLITHRNAGQIIPNKKDLWKVLYTHTVVNNKKQALDLELYPKTKDYLLGHFVQLSGRSYVAKANRNWYEIWVPQDPNAWEHRKIVFRDISKEPLFWLDNSKAVVNGDCYWINIHPDVTDATVYLALAVANSPFIEKYYDIKFNTKLYSGKRRYMAQYVEQFPIPQQDSEYAKRVIELVGGIISENNPDNVHEHKQEIDSLVEKLFL